MAFIVRAFKFFFRIGFGGLGRPSEFSSLKEALKFARENSGNNTEIYMYHGKMKINLKDIIDAGLDLSTIFSEK